MSLTCGYCGIPVSREARDGSRLHQDHIVPLSRGGGNDARNCIVSCATCNMEKHDRIPSEWKKSGLPDWIYEVEAELIVLYSMRDRRKRRGSPYSKATRDRSVSEFMCDVCEGFDTPSEYGLSLAWVCHGVEFDSPKYGEVIWCGLACGGDGHYCGDRMEKRFKGYLYDGPIEWFFDDSAWTRLRDLHANYKWPEHWFNELTAHLQKLAAVPRGTDARTLLEQSRKS